MELTVFERLNLMMILPAQANILKLRIVEDLRRSLDLTDEEKVAVEFKPDANGAQWNREKDVPVGIDICDAAKGVVVEVLKKLDEDEQLTTNHISLFEKFVEA